MDSVAENNATLPIDFDKTSLFPTLPMSDRKMRRQFSSPDNFSRESNSMYEPSEARPKSATLEKGSPDRAFVKNHENVIGVLKKENFGLKLRIYFLEDRLQFAYKEDTDEVLKRNIELKVTIEQLKTELVEKQELLVKASKAIETLTCENERRVGKVESEGMQNYQNAEADFINQMQEKDKLLRTKDEHIQKLQDQLLLCNDPKVDSGASFGMLDDSTPSSSDQTNADLKSELEDMRIQLHVVTERYASRCKEFEELRTASHENEMSLKGMVAQMENSLKEKEKGNEVLKVKFKSQNDGNATQIKELTMQLKCASDELETLRSSNNDRANAHSSEDNQVEEMKALRSELNAKAQELKKKSGIIDGLQEKHRVVQVDVFETKQNILNSLNVISRKDFELSQLKGDLKERDLSSSKMASLLQSKEKELRFLAGNKVELTKECELKLSTKDKEIKEAQLEMKTLVDQTNANVTFLKDKIKTMEEELRNSLTKKDDVINQMVSSLAQKDEFIGDLVDFNESAIDDGGEHSATGRRSSVLNLMHLKLQEKDTELKNHGDDRRQSLALKDDSIITLKTLQGSLEKELDHFRCQVSLHIASNKLLNDAVSDKQRLLEEMTHTIESQSKVNKDNEAVLENDVCQKEVLISKLSDLVAKKDKELTELQDAILNQAIEREASNTNLKDTLELVQKQLIGREKMLRTLSLERDAAAAQNERNRQKFISLLQEKDRQMKEDHTRHQRSSSETTASLLKLSTVVATKENELQALRAEVQLCKESSSDECSRLQATIEDKDTAIKSLVQMGCEKDKMISDLQLSNNRRTSFGNKEPHLECQGRNGFIFTPTMANQTEQPRYGQTVIKRQSGNASPLNDLLQHDDARPQSPHHVTQRGDLAPTPPTKDILPASKEGTAPSVQERDVCLRLLNALKSSDNGGLQFGSLEDELEAIKRLKNELEESFIKNENLRRRLEEETSHVFEGGSNAQESNDLQSELIRLKQRLIESERFSASLKVKLSNVDGVPQEDYGEEQEMKQLNMGNDDMARQLQLQVKENEELRFKVNRYDAEAQEINKRLLALRKEYELRCHSSEAERLTLLDQVRTCNGRIVELEQELLIVQELLHESDQESRDIDTLGIELAESQQQAGKAYEMIEKLNERLKENSKLAGENALLKADTDELRALNERLRQRLDETTHEALLGDTNSKVSMAMPAADQLELETATLKMQSQDVELKSLHLQLAEHRQEAENMKQLSDELLNLQSENQSLQERLNSVVTKAAMENERETGEICLLEDEVKYLRTVNDNLKSSLKATASCGTEIQELADRLKDYENKSVLHDEQQARLREQLNVSREAMLAKDNSILQYTTQINNLMSHIKSLEDDSKRLEDSNRKTEQQVVELQGRLSKLIAEKNASLSSTTGVCQCLYYEDVISNRDRQIDMLQKQLNVPASEQSGQAERGNGLIEEHIAEMRVLRKQLERSIHNNEALSAQLERRLTAIEQDSAKLSDPSLRSCLVRDNDSLRAQLESLRRHLEKSNTSLASIETELTNAKSELHAATEKINLLTGEKLRDKQTIDLLRKEISEINKVSTTLKDEISVYDKLHQRLGASSATRDLSMESFNVSDETELDSSMLRVLLDEIRNLRVLLQKSMDSNTLLRQRFEQQTERETELDAKSTICCHEHNLIGYLHADVTKIENALTNCMQAPAAKPNVEQEQPQNCDLDSFLRIAMETVLAGRKVVCDSSDAAHAALKDENEKLRRKIVDLTQKRTSQEHTIRSILERLETQYKVKEGVEQEVTSKLKKTRCVMQKARKELQVKVSKSESDTTGLTPSPTTTSL